MSARPVPRNLTVSATVGGGMICRLIPAALYQPLSRATIHGIQKPSATGHSWTIRIFVTCGAAVDEPPVAATTARATAISVARAARWNFIGLLLVRERVGTAGGAASTAF